MSARSYIFTASPTPSVVASTRAALKMIRNHPELRERLWDNSRRLYDRLAGAGFQLGPEPGPVVAVFIDDPTRAVSWWHRLLEQGVYVNLVIPPATPSTSCLLRCSISAAHSREQVDQIAEAFISLLPERQAAGSAV
jgi:8-amino-7-oxononanoate synthase